MVCWCTALATHRQCCQSIDARPLGRTWQNFVCGALHIMIIWRLTVLSLDAIKFAMNVN